MRTSNISGWIRKVCFWCVSVTATAVWGYGLHFNVYFCYGSPLKLLSPCQSSWVQMYKSNESFFKIFQYLLFWLLSATHSPANSLVGKLGPPLTKLSNDREPKSVTGHFSAPLEWHCYLIVNWQWPWTQTQRMCRSILAFLSKNSWLGFWLLKLSKEEPLCQVTSARRHCRYYRGQVAPRFPSCTELQQPLFLLLCKISHFAKTNCKCHFSWVNWFNQTQEYNKGSDTGWGHGSRLTPQPFKSFEDHLPKEEENLYDANLLNPGIISFWSKSPGDQNLRPYKSQCTSEVFWELVKTLNVIRFVFLFCFFFKRNIRFYRSSFHNLTSPVTLGTKVEKQNQTRSLPLLSLGYDGKEAETTGTSSRESGGCWGLES